MIQTPIPQLERSCGLAHLRLVRRAGVVGVGDLAQQGSAKVIVPRGNALRPEAVFLNTSGGLTSGDRLTFSVALADQVAATATTQTAERAYKATQGAAVVQVSAEVGVGGHLDWLPQETILYEDCNLQRATTISLAAGATCLMCESVVLGRRAMGEAPLRARLDDRRSISIQGRPVWAEHLFLDAQRLDDAQGGAVLGPNVAFAVLALVGAGTEAAATALRDVPMLPQVQSGVSGWNGRCLVRLMASDLWPLKQQLGRMIRQLTGRPLPRVWQMQGLAP